MSSRALDVTREDVRRTQRVGGNGRIVAVILEPHSEAWFDALEAFNAQQARHTRLILERAGRKDVCSICGDAPARDYLLNDASLPVDAVATLRLCKDCLRLRRKDGEAFLAIEGERHLHPTLMH